MGSGTSRGSFTFRFVSPEAFVAFFAEYYGPTVKAFEALDDAGQASLELELCELARSWDRLQERGAVAIPAEYLESCGHPERGATRLESRRFADVAQLVEHITRNDGVRGSSPRVGFHRLIASRIASAIRQT